MAGKGIFSLKGKTHKGGFVANRPNISKHPNTNLLGLLEPTQLKGLTQTQTQTNTKKAPLIKKTQNNNYIPIHKRNILTYKQTMDLLDYLNKYLNKRKNKKLHSKMSNIYKEFKDKQKSMTADINKDKELNHKEKQSIIKDIESYTIFDLPYLK